MAEPAVSLQPFVTYQEFVEWETAQEGRFEYDGIQVYAMSGASPRHNVLEVRLATLLSARLTGDCGALAAGQRISAAGDAQYVYADASVVCGDIALTPTHAALNPSAVFEVISDSSEGRDRGDKWHGYQQLASLHDYVLVSQHEVLIEQFQRSSDGWLYSSHGEGGALVLAGGVTLPIAAIYEGVWRYPSDRELQI